ncbi:unnamed protein product [Lactuca virosa]|uniref:Uncharacterized protein n=1 Tax=Lactuca virosa TaxID=75947 RepID=A0AAU9MCA3_9ASTR|nr:unnamed protein product [Lactuca virosa]
MAQPSENPPLTTNLYNTPRVVTTTGVTTARDLEHRRLRLAPPTTLMILPCSFSDDHWNNRVVTEPPLERHLKPYQICHEEDEKLAFVCRSSPAAV